MTESSEKIDSKQEKVDAWFQEFMHLLKTDQQFLKMGIASNETESLYDKLIFGSTDALMNEMRRKTTRFYIGKLVVDYVKTLKDLHVTPLNLYLDYNDSQVLVWAEIEDDDEKTELGLFKAEGVTNAKNLQSGFHISSTILEHGDSVSVPPHYQKLEIPQ